MKNENNLIEHAHVQNNNSSIATTLERLRKKTELIREDLKSRFLQEDDIVDEIADMVEGNQKINKIADNAKESFGNFTRDEEVRDTQNEKILNTEISRQSSVIAALQKEVDQAALLLNNENITSNDKADLEEAINTTNTVISDENTKLEILKNKLTTNKDQSELIVKKQKDFKIEQENNANNSLEFATQTVLNAHNYFNDKLPDSKGLPEDEYKEQIENKVTLKLEKKRYSNEVRDRMKKTSLSHSGNMNILFGDERIDIIKSNDITEATILGEEAVKEVIVSEIQKLSHHNSEFDKKVKNIENEKNILNKIQRFPELVDEFFTVATPAGKKVEALTKLKGRFDKIFEGQYHGQGLIWDKLVGIPKINSTKAQFDTEAAELIRTDKKISGRVHSNWVDIFYRYNEIQKEIQNIQETEKKIDKVIQILNDNKDDGDSALEILKVDKTREEKNNIDDIGDTDRRPWLGQSITSIEKELNTTLEQVNVEKEKEKERIKVIVEYRFLEKSLKEAEQNIGNIIYEKNNLEKEQAQAKEYLDRANQLYLRLSDELSDDNYVRNNWIKSKEIDSTNKKINIELSKLSDEISNIEKSIEEKKLEDKGRFNWKAKKIQKEIDTLNKELSTTRKEYDTVQQRPKDHREKSNQLLEISNIMQNDLNLNYNSLIKGEKNNERTISEFFDSIKKDFKDKIDEHLPAVYEARLDSYNRLKERAKAAKDTFDTLRAAEKEQTKNNNY